MLTKLLELLKQEESYSVEILAQKLGCDVEQVQMALKFLELSGHIKRVNIQPSCSGNCNRCHGCTIRGIGSLPVMWELTGHN